MSEEQPVVVESQKTFPELGHETLQGFIQATYKDIVQTTLCSNSLPAVNEDHMYWESYDVFKSKCSKLGTRILNDIGHLLEHSAIQCKWGYSYGSGKSTADIEDQFEKLVDANDILLENVSSLLDEAAGIKKQGEEEPIIMTSTLNKKNTAVSSWNKRKEFLNRSAPYKLLMAKNIHRPQLNWMDKIDNSNLPFVPFLNYKPNALKPKEDERKDRHIFNDIEKMKNKIGSVDFSSKHPYHYELTQFEPNEWQLEVQTPRMYLPLETTSLTMVDTQELLDEMMKKLKQVNEIVIDLEHHNYRSFQGIVCLIQMSTRKEDFIIDSLKLRDELCVLNEVLTDPAILKVLHGSDADIGWLQRDFGVYVVNMFDTGQAARTLQEARFSLAHLLQKYCNVTAQKQYQLADWRIRPLPAEMIRYAREDTHYLLYVYDILRNELLSRGNELQNLLRLVYTKSTSLCATLYKKQLCHPDSHILTYQKYKKNFSVQQLEAFRLLFQWRDKIARQEDESTGYVLPNHMMFQIAENLPKDQEGVIACCNPVPPLINKHVADVVRLAAEGRFYEGPGEQLECEEFDDLEELGDVPKENDVQRFKNSTIDARSGFEIYHVTGPKISVLKPTLTVYNGLRYEDSVSAGEKRANEIMKSLRSPFELYLPNTGTPSVDPKDINEAWQNLCKEKMDEPVLEEVPAVATPLVAVVADEEYISLNTASTVGKKRRRKHGLDEEEKTLRELLPKKSRMRPLDEHLDKEMGREVPVKLDYQRNLNVDADFVPFDYSKADLKKFDKLKTAKDQTSGNFVNLDRTEEPDLKGPIKTKIHSGARQMSL